MLDANIGNYLFTQFLCSLDEIHIFRCLGLKERGDAMALDCVSQKDNGLAKF